MKVVFKSFAILLVVFLIRTLSGCCDCDDYYNEIKFNFEKLSIINLNNDREVAVVSTSDTMNRESVAFQVLFTSSGSYLSKKETAMAGFGFSKVSAFEKCDCAETYVPENPIKNFAIRTSFSFNRWPAGLDVSDSMNYYIGKYAGTGLYTSKSQVISEITRPTCNFDGIAFQFFAPNEVVSDSAQFVVEITLSDNTIISNSTHRVYLKKTRE